MNFKVGRPSAATVMSALALFISLGGASYAATQIGSAQVKDNSIQSRDIRDGTILSRDIATRTVASLRGRTGPTGPAGSPGPPGAPGVAGYEVVSRSNAIVANTLVQTFTTLCPAGKKALGGGVVNSNSTTNILASFPTDDHTGWSVEIDSNDGRPLGLGAEVSVYVVCAVVG
jgi:hypothetical protein